jgi:hypothetical protein
MTTLPESINSLFIGLPSLYSVYSTQAYSTSSYSTESDNLDRQLQKQNLQLQELNRQEETYDREFLDRKQNPSNTGFLYKIGLRTTEDWVFIYFFFSYILFILILLIYVMIYSTKKIYAVAAITSTGILVGILSTFLLYRYA